MTAGHANRGSDRPLCFVLMPFGLKPDPAGGPKIDFTRIYLEAIKPGVLAAGMQPVRADEEKLGGIIHKSMFERLIVCEYAVADLTTGNANVMYELGVRHAARPRTTLALHAEANPLPFDVALLRTQRYRLGSANAFPDADAEHLRGNVTRQLVELRELAQIEGVQDSPLFQLVAGWRPPPLPLQETEAFRDRVTALETVKDRLRRIAAAARNGLPDESADQELDDIRAQVHAHGAPDPGVVSELLIALRARGAWSPMIELFRALPRTLTAQVQIRQYAAFAYNRRAEDTEHDLEPDAPARSAAGRDRIEALGILQELERDRGPDPETSGLLGRVHKSRWLAARRSGDHEQARRSLADAVRAYVRGFEADWRAIYPGINALTLLEAQGGPAAADIERRLLPVVRFAAEQQRLRSGSSSYWVHATLLELAVLTDDESEATVARRHAEDVRPEPWQRRTTADNLRIIRDARDERGRPTRWITEIIDALDPSADLQV